MQTNQVPVEKKSRHKSKELLSHTNRGRHTIRIPTNELSYNCVIDDRAAFRAKLDELMRLYPELFPQKVLKEGYHLKELRHSKKLEDFYYYIIRTPDRQATYTVHPCFVLPYLKGYTQEVATALELMMYGVPSHKITELYGRDDSYWDNLFNSLGRFSVVGTLVKSPDDLPEDYCADEKITHWNAQKISVCMVAAKNCLFCCEATLSGCAVGLQRAYGVFKQEACWLKKCFAPVSINIDGWKATRLALNNLFASAMLVLCFLHGFIKIRNVAQKEPHVETLYDYIWQAYHAENAEDFQQGIEDLQAWMKTVELRESTRKNVQKLIDKSTQYQQAYQRKQAHRTSNTVDRPMRMLDRFLFNKQYFHGHFKKAQLKTRAFANCFNFMPLSKRCLKYKQKPELYCRAAQFNQRVYRQNWLENLIVAASLNGYRDYAP